MVNINNYGATALIDFVDVRSISIVAVSLTSPMLPPCITLTMSKCNIHYSGHIIWVSKLNRQSPACN
jgi:hypothetical protein